MSQFHKICADNYLVVCVDDDLGVSDEDKSAENYQSELLKLVNEVSSHGGKMTGL